MACNCKENFEVIGNVKIGRNKITCQECLNKQEQFDRARLKAEKQSELNALEQKSLRKLFDGEDLTEVNAKRLELRSAIQSLS